MPSTKKSLHFMSSALVTAISAAVMGIAMSRQWATMSLECARAPDQYNGSAVIRLELFTGNLIRNSCPFFIDQKHLFVVFPMLVETGGAPVVLHGLVLGLLAVCLLFSACSLLISLYNSVSNPYQTYMGPVGVYICNSLSACLAAVVLIMYVLNVHVTDMAEGVVRSHNQDVYLRNKAVQMDLGYFLVILYIVLCLGAIGLIYLYDHAAYTHRKEQQKPTEDAPKEIMMY